MRAKKLFAAILAAIICAGAMSGCASTESTESTENTSEFAVVHTGDVPGARPADVYVHKETRVMYMWVEAAYGGGLTVMLDSGGKPLLYEGELEEG